ncbi:hypothetical protein RI578_06390 [Streptomyces sp. BB1-1-1]|uniref:hypothetical protein n=1 Tax=Streptomyces sp. BB1-1-1 TaxID=3074430 RepID=UPI002877A1EE|nr:hypothetical protein [Streptomyces sp. BB1-1-1]WND33941.1 hypothetical protein RI578_06390 [Streptomyces sp. BB1-1-1]
MAKLSTLFDAFDGDGLDTTLWNDSVGATQTLGDGYAAVAPSAAYTNWLGFTPPSRDFTEDTFTWEWTYTGAAVAGIEQYCTIGSGTAGQEIAFGRYSTSLGYFVGADDGFVPWVDADHRWCRIRTTSTQVIFETSPDGVTWVNPFAAGGGGAEALPAWDLSNVHVHFVNGYFSGSGGGDQRLHTVGVATNTMSGSVHAALGGAGAQLHAELSSPGSASLALGGPLGAGAGRLVSRTSLAGVLGGARMAVSGHFESSAEDVTLSVGPTRVAALGVGPTVLSPEVAETILEREP